MGGMSLRGGVAVTGLPLRQAAKWPSRLTSVFVSSHYLLLYCNVSTVTGLYVDVDVDTEFIWVMSERERDRGIER